MLCLSCNADNPIGAKFCCVCGKPMEEQETKPILQDDNDVVGKTCPYCQTPFKTATDVVYCPQCKMPHHKDCWNDNGGKCTIFGCLGMDARQEESAPVIQTPTVPITNIQETIKTEAVNEVNHEIKNDTAGSMQAKNGSSRGIIAAAVAIIIVVGGIMYSVGQESGSTQSQRTKQSETKQEQFKQEQIKQEQMKQEQIRQEQLRQERLKQEQMSRAKNPAMAAFSNFHMDITDKNYVAAHKMFSEEQQKRIEFTGWKNGYAQTITSTVTECKVIMDTDNKVKLAYTLKARDNDRGRVKVQIFKGVCTMVRENGRWVIGENESGKAGEWYE